LFLIQLSKNILFKQQPDYFTKTNINKCFDRTYISYKVLIDSQRRSPSFGGGKGEVSLTFPGRGARERSFSI